MRYKMKLIEIATLILQNETVIHLLVVLLG